MLFILKIKKKKNLSCKRGKGEFNDRDCSVTAKTTFTEVCRCVVFLAAQLSQGTTAFYAFDLFLFTNIKMFQPKAESHYTGRSTSTKSCPQDGMFEEKGKEEACPFCSEEDSVLRG